MYKALVNKIIEREKAEGKIDISLVDDRTIRRLNREFRKKDKATDVLAFPYGRSVDPEGIIGDVIIARDTTRKNAKRYGTSLKNEMKRLVIHGVLHVLGYDHGRRMSRAEKIYSQF